MTKQEFLNALSAKLYEELPTAEVLDQIRYYEGYIDGEMARGKTEEQITEELGDPNVIAKSILNAPRQTYDSGQEEYQQGYTEAQQAYKETSSGPADGINRGKPEENTYKQTQKAEKNNQFFRMPDGSFNWGGLTAILVAVLIIVAILWLVVKVVSIFWPLIVVLIIAGIVVSIFKKNS